MAKISRDRIVLLLKGAWNGALGIASEVLLTAFFILAGFLVCLFWWSFK